MGRQTGSICAVFLSAHVAIILAAISMATHYWIEAKLPVANQTDTTHSDTTVLTYSKGLWRYCYENVTTIYEDVAEDTHNVPVFNHTVYESEECFKAGKEHYNSTTEKDETQAMFHLTQYMYTIGTGMLALAIIQFYIYMFTGKSRRSICLASFMVLFFLIAGVFMFIGILITGLHYNNDYDFYDLDGYNFYLGWSYFLAIAGDALTCISFIASIIILHKIRSNPAPYENLDMYA